MILTVIILAIIALVWCLGAIFCGICVAALDRFEGVTPYFGGALYHGVELEDFTDDDITTLDKDNRSHRTARGWFPDSLSGLPKTRYQMIRESIYSFTPFKVADKMTRIIIDALGDARTPQTATITDATANVGGNTLNFSQYFGSVNAIEINPLACQALKNNIDVYGASDKVQVLCKSYLDVARDLSQDIIFFDPPWGGVDYRKHKQLVLKLSGFPLQNILIDILSDSQTALVAIKAPRNFAFAKFKEDLSSGLRDTRVKIWQIEFHKNMMVFVKIFTSVPQVSLESQLIPEVQSTGIVVVEVHEKCGTAQLTDRIFAEYGWQNAKHNRDLIRDAPDVNVAGLGSRKQVDLYYVDGFGKYYDNYSDIYATITNVITKYAKQKIGDKLRLYNILDSQYMFEQVNVTSLFDLEQNEELIGESLWIIRPAHQWKGKGIMIKQGYNDIHTHISNQIKENSDKPNRFAVSRYEVRPLLWNGNKFHIRLFFVARKRTPSEMPDEIPGVRISNIQTFLLKRGVSVVARKSYVARDFDDDYIHNIHSDNSNVYNFPIDFQEQFPTLPDPMPRIVEMFEKIAPHVNLDHYEDIAKYPFYMWGADIIFLADGTPMMLELNHTPSPVWFSRLDGLGKYYFDTLIHLVAEPVMGKLPGFYPGDMTKNYININV